MIKRPARVGDVDLVGKPHRGKMTENPINRAQLLNHNLFGFQISGLEDWIKS